MKLEKSLADLESKRLSVRNVEREKRNAKRYRKIRFIERQKLSRKLKQLHTKFVAYFQRLKVSKKTTPKSMPHRKDKGSLKKFIEVLIRTYQKIYFQKQTYKKRLPPLRRESLTREKNLKK